MKKLHRVLAVVPAALSLAFGGVAEAETGQGYRVEIHDCWIGATHYGSRTSIYYSAHRYDITLITYQTSPPARAHRVEWKSSYDKVVQAGMGKSRFTRNDVPPKAELTVTKPAYEEGELIFTVWDGATGRYCRDSHPIVRH